jgi:hypothetical protein
MPSDVNSAISIHASASPAATIWIRPTMPSAEDSRRRLRSSPSSSPIRAMPGGSSASSSIAAEVIETRSPTQDLARRA